MNLARKALLLCLLVVALSVAMVSGVAYVEHRLWLGALAVGLLGIIAVFGAATLFHERRRLAELLVDLAAKQPSSTLWKERRGRLEALAKAGLRPDLDLLAQSLRAAETSRAFLGKYFVAVTVLVGLVGTFAGLMEMLRGVQPLLQTTTAPALDVLLQPLVGLDVTFGASVVGILVTLALTLQSGDLQLAEEAMLACIEERTAHELVPALWPPSESSEEKILRLLGGWHAKQEQAVTRLASELASTIGKTFGKEAHQLVVAIEEVVGAAHQRTLGRLDETLEKTTGATLLRLETSIARTLAELSGGLQAIVKQVDQSTRQTMAALQATSEQTTARLGQSTHETLARFAEVATATGAALEQGARLTLDRLAATAGETGQAFAQGTQQTLDRLTATASETSQAFAQGTQQTLDRLAATASETSQALAQGTQQTLDRLAASSEATRASIEQRAEVALERFAATTAEAARALDHAAAQTLARLGEQSTQTLAQLGASSDRTVKQLDQGAQALLTGLAERSAAYEARHGALLAAQVAPIVLAQEKLSAQLGDLLEQHRAAVGQHTAALAEEQIAARQTFVEAIAALRPLLDGFGRAAQQLASETERLAPELSALTAEVALLAARTDGGASPIVLDELARLAGSVAELQSGTAEPQS